MLRTIFIHLAVWGAIVIALLLLFLPNQSNFPLSFGRIMALLSLSALVFYANAEYLIPKFYEKRQYIRYGLAVLGLLITTIALVGVLTQLHPAGRVVQINMDGDLQLAATPPGPIAWLSQFVLFGFSALLSFSYKLIQHNQRRERIALARINEQQTAELNFLRSQINPHFLFNTLNNIYALIRLNPNKAGEGVSQLSEMLRYMLYGSDSNKVLLGQEIAYLKNYIWLMALKDSTMENISFNYLMADNTLKIAPLLLIPFVENAFKHSQLEVASEAWIIIDLQTTDNELIFKVRNNCSPNQSKDSVGGIGLENVKRRLELLYPNEHELTILETAHEFSILLKIPVE